MNEIKTSIDIDKLVSKPVTMPFPHIYIEDISRYAATVVKSLPTGDLPIVATHNGVTKIVARISKSAYNISKLLRVSDIVVRMNDIEVVKVEDIRDYMEVALKWI